MAVGATYTPKYNKNASDYEKLDFLVDSVRNEDEECIKNRLHRMVYEAVNHPLRALYELESSLNYQYTSNGRTRRRPWSPESVGPPVGKFCM